LFAHAGLREIRRWYRMTIKLDEAMKRPLRQVGISLRSFEPGRDDRAIYDSYQDGFADHWNFWSQDFKAWLCDLTERDGFEPSLIFLAWDGDEIAGAAICRKDQEDSDGGFIDDLWVRQPWRRRGIGPALLLQSFTEFKRVARDTCRSA
jgi:mycothiol synthase